MRISTTQFALTPVDHAEAFWTRVSGLCLAAHADRANAICLPEYFAVAYGLRLAQTGTFRERLRHFTRHVETFRSRLQEYADQFGLLIVAGTVPVVEDGRLINRSLIVRPRLPTLHQDKIHMTRFEDEEWRVTCGERALQVFSWQGVQCAVVVCYDIEFPQVSLALASAGVQLAFVPSCTDTEHGYWRVRHTAEARAVENQMFLAISSIVKGDPGFREIDQHYGRGVILAPCDGRFPANGTLAEGSTGHEGQVTAELDLAELRHVRQNGAVLNWRDSKAANHPIRIHFES